MYCNAQAANPTATYDWKDENGDFIAQYSNSLQIGNIQRTDKGRYTCTATNQMTPTGKADVTGTATKNVAVNVQCEYSFIMFVCFLFCMHWCLLMY